MIFPPIIFSIFAGFGLSVAITQKGDTYPLSLVYRPLESFLLRFLPKWVGVLDCLVCFSFWGALIANLLIYLLPYSITYWVLSGFIALALSWVINEAIPPKGNNNV